MTRPSTLREVRRVKRPRSQRQSKRVVLVLSCGHTKLHNPRTPVPKSARCAEC